LYRIIQASHTSTEIPELRLCPSQIWGDSDEIVVSDTSITFLVKKNKELQKVVVNAERPPVVPRVEKGSESQGSMESNKKRKDPNAEIPDTTKEPRVSPRKKKNSNAEVPDTTKEPRVSPRKKKNSNAKIPDATEEPMVSQKKKKNSNTPKLKSKSPVRSKSAYNLFFKEAYNAAKAKGPSLKMAEINSIVAEEWHSLSANKRKKYEEKANEEKLLLAEEKEKNTPPPSEDDDKEIEIATTKKKRKRKDPQMPKFYATAYKLYTASIRAETKAKNPEISFGEMSKVLADKWNSLSSTEKLKFEELSQKDKARYTEEMSKYEPPEDASEEEVTAKKKKKTKDPNAPKGRLNVFMSFSNDMRPKIKEENPEASFLQIASILGEKYKQLTPSQKAKYQKIADQDKARYEKEMAKYKSKGKDIEVNVNADNKQDKDTDDELPAEKPAQSKKEIRRDSTGVRKEMNTKSNRTGSKKSTTTVTPKKKKTPLKSAVESVVGRSASPVTTRSKRSKKQASRKKKRRSKTT
jgi:hypothetical protein